MVNYLAVLVAAIAAHVLGFLWYGPLFGKTWMKLMNISDKDKDKAKQKGMAKLYVLSTIGSLIMAGVIAVLLEGNVNLMSGLLIGLLGWLGFMVPKGLGAVLWEGKPWSLYALNTTFDLVSLLMMGAILGVWA